MALPKVVSQRWHTGNAIVAVVHRLDDGTAEYFTFHAGDPPAMVPTYRTVKSAEIGCDTELERRGHRCRDECGPWTVPPAD